MVSSSQSREEDSRQEYRDSYLDDAQVGPWAITVSLYSYYIYRVHEGRNLRRNGNDTLSRCLLSLAPTPHRPSTLRVRSTTASRERQLKESGV